MKEEFKDVELRFEELKKKFHEGKISRTEFIERLKKLRLKDEEGRFWMVGAKSGKWYYYDGNNWIQADPPSLQEGKAICIHCGFENSLEAEACIRCGQGLGQRESESETESEKYCPDCGYWLEDPQLGCPYCKEQTIQEKQEEVAEKKIAEEERRGKYLVFRYLNPLSCLYFLGTAGIFVGLIIGAFAGTTDFFQTFIKIMPHYLKELQGTLIGGVMYAFSGGICGFVLFGLAGLLAALFFNFISSFVGGIKVRLD